jgi:FkbM family methyltransferase
MQLPPVSYGYKFSDFLSAYYRGPDHPCKLRILGWIESLAGRKRIAVKTTAGFRFAVDRRDYIQNTVFQTGRWEDEIEDVLRLELREQDVLFDIGANVGYFSFFALQHACRKVVAFEPNPELQALFSFNMQLNGFSVERCELVRFALSDKQGNLVYQEGPVNNSGTGRLLVGTGSGGINVKVESLDSLLECSGLPLPTVIKLDVEGWEAHVLRGAEKLFRNSPPRVVLFEADCSKEARITDPELAQFFLDRGYEIKHLPRDRIEPKENFLARLTRV